MSRLVSFPFMLLLALMAGGCDSSQHSEKKSLFEHDHSTPAHWPHDLSDLCRKFAERLDSPQASNDAGPSEQNESELNDLVNWIPEIAADSDLTEAEWLPICNAAELLQSRIEKDGWNEQTRAEARTICELVASEARRLDESGGKSEGRDGGNGNEHEHEHEREQKEEEHEQEEVREDAQRLGLLGSPETQTQQGDARMSWLAESNEGHRAMYDAEFRR